MAHELEEVDLLIGARSEIRVTAFAGHDLVARAIPEENTFAEAGACGEESARSSGERLAGIENAKIFGREVLEAVAGGAQIIDENDRGEIKITQP